MRAAIIRLLLAAAVGALLVGAWSLATDDQAPTVGGIASASVIGTASCGGQGHDVVTVAAPEGPVMTTLDGCGRAVGAVVTVTLATDGSVPNPVSLAGTRAPSSGSALPAVVLLLSALVAAGLGVAALRTPATVRSTSEPLDRAWQG